MWDRLLFTCLAACAVSACATGVETPEIKDSSSTKNPTIECIDCEMFNPIWQAQEQITCVHDKRGVWGFNNMTCSVE
jgi:hypothetical protein